MKIDGWANKHMPKHIFKAVTWSMRRKTCSVSISWRRSSPILNMTLSDVGQPEHNVGSAFSNSNHRGFWYVPWKKNNQRASCCIYSYQKKKKILHTASLLKPKWIWQIFQLEKKTKMPFSDFLPSWKTWPCTCPAIIRQEINWKGKCRNGYKETTTKTKFTFRNMLQELSFCQHDTNLFLFQARVF